MREVCECHCRVTRVLISLQSPVGHGTTYMPGKKITLEATGASRAEHCVNATQCLGAAGT